MRPTAQWLAIIVILIAVLPAGVQEITQASGEVWVETIGAPYYFAVLVENVDESVAWYQAVFGLDVLDDTEAPDGAWRIVNLSRPNLFVEIIRDARAVEVDRALGFFKTGFRVPDVRTVAARVEEATGERPRVVESPRHGLRLLQLQDPDGNTIQLSSPLD